MIIDTVHGANTAKIRNYHMDENPYYGQLAKVPVYKLRQVMNHLMLDEYLMATNDEYAIIKLTDKSESILDGDESIFMKMAREQERVPKEVKEKKAKTKAAGAASLNDQETELFERLRALRMETAREEKVPPYVVFSDKTLVHMCILKPATKAQMLQVSGVGEFKYEKYGERFLNCVLEMFPEGTDVSGLDEQSFRENTDPAFEVMPKRSAPEKKNPKGKTAFVLDEMMAAQYHFSENITLGDFVGQLNDFRDETCMKRLTGKAILQRLTLEGYVENYAAHGRVLTRPTDKGTAAGITTQKRTSEKGNEYEVLYYSEGFQRELLHRLQSDWLHLMEETAGENN